jgi:2,4-dienoyl-CoA reductase-like NADH-dependent reductase (Old Yellow Enzyme family)
MTPEVELTLTAKGTIVFGNVPCDRRYPESKNNAVIDKTAKWDHVAAFKPVFAAAKAHGSLAIIQLTHAGRQTSNEIADVPISASDVQCPPMGKMVRLEIQCQYREIATDLSTPCAELQQASTCYD